MTRLACCLLLVALSACSRDEPPPEPPPEEVIEEPEEPEEEPEYLQIRQVFGLPLPPEITDVRRAPNFFEAGTKLRMEEIEGFFRSRLVDYEFVWVGPNMLQIIGLRSTMPKIFVMRKSRMGPRRVRYVPQASPVTDQHQQQEQAKQQPYEPPKPGDKIERKLSDGRELAPGAVYGQPYTPKPGDPLYTESNRANFGKPFGTWILN